MAAPAAYPAETIARLLDLTPRRVQQLVAESVIPRAERGRYEVVPVVRAYVRYLRERAMASEVGQDAFAQHRARLTKARADMAELEHAQMLQDLVPAAQVEQAWAALVGVLRSRLLALPSKLAPRLAGLAHEAPIQEHLRAEITDALAELSEAELTLEPLRASDPGADGEADDPWLATSDDDDPHGAERGDTPADADRL
jgi:phage terminase Nu1 subunit (DNA packaging protein)